MAKHMVGAVCWTHQQMGEALRQNPHFLAKGEKEKQTLERKLLTISYP